VQLGLGGFVILYAIVTIELMIAYLSLVRITLGACGMN